MIARWLSVPRVSLGLKAAMAASLKSSKEGILAICGMGEKLVRKWIQEWELDTWGMGTGQELEEWGMGTGGVGNGNWRSGEWELEEWEN